MGCRRPRRVRKIRSRIAARHIKQTRSDGRPERRMISALHIKQCVFEYPSLSRFAARYLMIQYPLFFNQSESGVPSASGKNDATVARASWAWFHGRDARATGRKIIPERQRSCDIRLVNRCNAECIHLRARWGEDIERASHQ